ncbi:MAG: VanZ family protein [Deltaproteobacteria bacterium]|nr:VanZ family protein [Deltaproteobacteria bacterium]
MKKNAWISGILLVAYCALIFYLSSLPGSSISFLPFSDKVKHFFLYLGFGSIFAYFLKNLKSDLPSVAIGIVTLFFILIYGLSDEIHQLFVPGRTFDLRDLLADGFGGTSGGFLILFLHEFSRTSGKVSTKNKERNPQ